MLEPRTTLPLTLALAAMLAGCGGTGRAPDQEREAKPPARATAGETALTLDPERQARAGIRTQPLAAVDIEPETVAYGRLMEDPAASFVVRTPAAGTLRANPAGAWPALGQRLEAGAAIGTVEPRLTAAERLALTERLASARADAAAGEATLAASRAAFERARTLNADGKNISDRALQEAEARLRSDEARWRAATQTVRIIESAVEGRWSSPAELALARPGEVVEVMAQPGESVESGQPVLRVARFDALLARVDVPAGQAVPPEVASARLVAVGREDRPLNGERVALGAAVDPATQGQAFVFRLKNPKGDLRPGLAVAAWLRLPGRAQHGVLIPRGAVVHAAARHWVYVQVSDDRFERRELFDGRPIEKGWFAAAGLAPGVRIVVVGAQALLSEELKSQLRDDQ